jgi:hypothetical protein
VRQEHHPHVVAVVQDAVTDLVMASKDLDVITYTQKSSVPLQQVTWGACWRACAAREGETSGVRAPWSRRPRALPVRSRRKRSVQKGRASCLAMPPRVRVLKMVS